MPQLLELLKKGNRITPTVYKLGANEHLNIHAADSYADLTDAATGSYVRQIGWDGLRDMGYSPAKLLAGNETDQFMTAPKPSLLVMAQSYGTHALAGLAVAVVISIVSATTGCTTYLLSQAEQDVATSTVAPRLAESDSVPPVILNQNGSNLSDVIYSISNEAETARHANSVIAKAYGRAL